MNSLPVPSAAFRLEPFTPPWGLRNPHMQSVLANGLRPQTGVSFRRQRLDTPDGDFVDLDFADVAGASWADLGDKAAIVLLLHGLEGSARRGYACETYKPARGIRAVGLNFRSCSGEMNRTAYLYHAGATGDVALVMNWLGNQFPGVAKGMVGFSLGANVLLKYLGEREDEVEGQVATAVAVSPPFDMVAGSQAFNQGHGRLYARLFLRTLKEKTRAHTALLADKIDVDQVLRAQTVAEFDDALTAPLHGFRDAQDYYTRCGAGRFLPGVRVPTLLLRARDDPFFGDDLHLVSQAANPFLVPGFTDHGGHVGFLEGLIPRRFWAERQAARFLAHYLNASARGS
ncbi:MAG: alpha/beta hydrolase [Ardenticatenaceae bacterium]|nr:alpha/beta hydrolase [Ardenticatenaceae bacterium]MCB8987418.1 alpha/beta hydrolase [Ardenticatenaceae bacterium]